jgi:hypothetical protein
VPNDVGGRGNALVTAGLGHQAAGNRTPA